MKIFIKILFFACLLIGIDLITGGSVLYSFEDSSGIVLTVLYLALPVIFIFLSAIFGLISWKKAQKVTKDS